MHKPTLTSYILGFMFSILLTLLAFDLVTNHLLASRLLVPTILVLAVIQLIVQLIFFLHLFSESRPRLNLVALVSTVGLILIIIIASLWIMKNLTYHHLTPEQINDYVKDQGAF